MKYENQQAGKDEGGAGVWQCFRAVRGRTWNLLVSDSDGAVMMEYILVSLMMLTGGAILNSGGSRWLFEVAGVPVDATEDFGIVGSAMAVNLRRLMWMVSQPFP